MTDEPVTDDPRGTLQPAPTVASWRERLARSGTVELTSFSGMELASVGAGGPLRGLVATDAFLTIADGELNESLERARRGLVERGLAGPARPGGGRGRVVMELGGDLAGIVAVRRSPALVASVSAAGPDAVEHPTPSSAASAVLAVLHGVTAAEGGLFALLEETLAGDVHLFSLSTPEAQAMRILEACQVLEDDGPVSVSVHVFVPHPVQPRHVQLALEPGVARMSTDGVSWSRSCPDYRWPQLFTSAVTL